MKILILYFLLNISIVIPFKFLLAESLYIGVASNFLKPMKVLKYSFENKNKSEIFISSGSSGSLYTQIINGAPLDIFLSADQNLPKKLEKNSRAVLATRFTYATGKLLVYSTNKNIMDQKFPQLLMSNKIKYIGIGNPKFVPYGRAAQEVLNSLNIFKKISSKLVFNKNVNQVFLMNYYGNLDLGFIAKSDFIKKYKKGKTWNIPQNLYSPIKQDAILLKNGEKKKNAINFLKFLSSKKTKEKLKKFGYIVD